MSDFLKAWLRWLLVGVGLVALSGADCVDQIRTVGQGLGDLADTIDGGEEDDNDLGDFFDDLEDLFD